MAGGSGSNERSLEQTPTWAVALVCLTFILISLALEHIIHRLGQWLGKKENKALQHALEKLKSELMILGFISLLLTVGQEPVSKICVPKGVATVMLPCAKEDVDAGLHGESEEEEIQANIHSRRLLMDLHQRTVSSISRRMLASEGGTEHCAQKGKYPLISQTGMHQLHLFIFVLAVLHVVLTLLTVGLGQAKMRRWKAWERETESLEYRFHNDSKRFRLTKDISFVTNHNSSWNNFFVFKLIACFLRQFYPGATKEDYLTMRHGFINAHFAPNSDFNFHKYIKRSLENDFATVVGISPVLWIFAVIFLLINVYGWYAYFWLSFVPLLIVLVIGTKLEYVITDMALEIEQKNAVVKGVPLVKPSDQWFWFNHPKLVLYLIHFTLFENAFQLAYILWIWKYFGVQSCFHDRFFIVIVKISTGVVVQFTCSYFTLPLYALVTQMGDNMSTAVFHDKAANALNKWHRKANKRCKKNDKSADDTSIDRTASEASTPTVGSSPVHLLHRHKSMGHIEPVATYCMREMSSATPSPSHRQNEITPFPAPAAPAGAEEEEEENQEIQETISENEEHSFAFNVRAGY